jgi:hypothetical protein
MPPELEVVVSFVELNQNKFYYLFDRWTTLAFAFWGRVLPLAGDDTRLTTTVRP